MSEILSTKALAVRPCLVCCAQREKRIVFPIILDTSDISHILQNLYLFKGRVHIMGKSSSTMLEIFILLVRYLIEAIESVVIFGIFVITSMAINWIGERAGGIGILLKVVGWSISVCGAICCITLIIRNTIVFIKFLIKGPPQIPPSQSTAVGTGPPQGTSGPNVAGKGGV